MSLCYNGFMAGYHIRKIQKGVFGESSKIQEELSELIDAELQGCRIMALMEASDLYGALEAWAIENGTSMVEIRIMSHITRRAFESGERE